MPVNTRQKCYDTNFLINFNNHYNSLFATQPINNNVRSPSPSKRVSVGSCKYRRVLVENIIEQVDRGRNEIFSPLPIKDRLRSANLKFI